MAEAATIRLTVETQSEFSFPGEEYAHSASTLRRWGEFIVNSANIDETATTPYEELGYDDFFSAVTEMLKTDKEHRKRLEVNRQKEHTVIDNQVCAADGTPMVELIRAGFESSTQDVKSNPELEGQAARDGLDVENAERVDELQVGMTRFVLSMPPKNLLKKYPKTYGELGYEEDLAYIQSYSKVDEKSLISGAYSIDLSDEQTWRPLLKELGFDIPDDESPDTWLQHGLEKEMSPDAAKQFALSTRQQYYARRGSSGERFSANEYCERNVAVIEDYFNTYYPAMAEAIATGNNNAVMKDLALAVLQGKTDKLKSDIKSQLIKIGNSTKFGSEDAKVMDSVIRYAAVEELRAGLANFTDKQVVILPPRSANISRADVPMDVLNAAMHVRLANNVSSGIEAGRSYGGCPGRMQLNAENEDPLGLDQFSAELPGHQEAYGGKDCLEVKDGQLVKCPGCKKQVKAIVPNRETIFCSNGDCDLAEPSLKHHKSNETSAAKASVAGLFRLPKKDSK